MATPQEWCADKLSNLLNEELRIFTLNEIRDHLQSIPQEEVTQTVDVLELPLVFDCLNDTNTQQIDLACEVLSLCLGNLNIGESTTRYGISLERALTHPYPGVKLMALTELERNVKNDDILVALCKRASLLKNITKCLEVEDISVSKKASNILVLVGTSDAGIKQFTSADLLKAYQEVQSVRDVIRLRLFQVFIDISKESRNSFEVLNSAGLISPIIDELANNDVLLRLNIIELLTQFGLTEHGFLYLESNNVMSKLFHLLQDDNHLMDVALSEPGIIKFYGNMAHWKPGGFILKYPKMLKRILNNLESTDPSIIGVSLDTLGYIGLKNEGKCALDSAGTDVPQGLKFISNNLGSFTTELTIHALKCWENLLRVTDEHSQVSAITKSWFYLIGENPMTLFLKYAKNPFAELRVSGLGVIHAIGTQHWGQEVIKSTPGFIEFLLDRNAETHKQCKEAKYDIIKLLSSSSVFDQAMANRFETYIGEGPFFVQGIMEVAFEGNE